MVINVLRWHINECFSRFYQWTDKNFHLCRCAIAAHCIVSVNLFVTNQAQAHKVEFAILPAATYLNDVVPVRRFLIAHITIVVTSRSQKYFFIVLPC